MLTYLVRLIPGFTICRRTKIHNNIFEIFTKNHNLLNIKFSGEISLKAMFQGVLAMKVWKRTDSFVACPAFICTGRVKRLALTRYQNLFWGIFSGGKMTKFFIYIPTQSWKQTFCCISDFSLDGGGQKMFIFYPSRIQISTLRFSIFSPWCKSNVFSLFDINTCYFIMLNHAFPKISCLHKQDYLYQSVIATHRASH